MAIKKANVQPAAAAPALPSDVPDTEQVTFPIKFLSPTSLKPYYQNSKKHSRQQITLLAKAIRSVGFDQPIVVDKDLVIIKGHGRRLAALELKIDHVPVLIRDDLTDIQVMASRIADNQAHTLSEIDVPTERSEIQSYIEGGGSDASVFFDFMTKPTGATLQVPGATSPTPKGSASVSGQLLSCSKCGHTYLEAKKS